MSEIRVQTTLTSDMTHEEQVQALAAMLKKMFPPNDHGDRKFKIVSPEEFDEAVRNAPSTE